MAPQEHIPVAANVLGTIGTILWCVQLVPQVYTNWRTKSTEGLPGTMMFLWALCGVPFGVYAIMQNFNIPLQVQPHCFMALCLVSWAQTLFYHSKWALWKVLLVAIATGAIFGGVEAALILTLSPLYDHGNTAPAVAIGVIAAVFLAAGLLPPYGEAWKRRGRIIGINWIFLTMDSMGAFFSLMSLVAQNSFDVLGGVMYIVCMLLEIGIFSSHIIWLWRTRRLRKEAKAQDKTFDDIAAEYEREGRPFKFAERKTPAWLSRRKKHDEEQGSDTDTQANAVPDERKEAEPKEHPARDQDRSRSARATPAADVDIEEKAA
ncbi:PQ loop repeat-domain-containing protein [Xylariomycetidae sp. FL0641]|nr:PQ loop repeat-domain-containing protein [Xylariomycetidae sp. FL0641]